MIIQQLLTLAIKRLSDNGIVTPALDSNILLANALKKTKLFLLSNPEYMPDHSVINCFWQLMERRCKREPIAKIIGHKEFWGIKYMTSNATLDPRPDSEVIIEAVLYHFQDRQRPLKILDLGTGSGCLILTILKEYQQSCGVGIDISKKALNIAQKNACNLKLDHRLQLIQSNWCDRLSCRNNFDVIIANPPYISSLIADQLAPELNYEPKQALFVQDKYGISAYKLIAASINNFLNSSGKVFLEVGNNLSDFVQEIMQQQDFKLIKYYKDLSNVKRCGVFYK